MPILRLSDLRFEPDKTRLWDAHPGTVYAMSNWVPLPRGTYSTFGSAAFGGSSGTLGGTASPISASQALRLRKWPLRWSRPCGR